MREPRITPMGITFKTDEEVQAFHDWANGKITGEEYGQIREKFGYKKEKAENKSDIKKALEEYRQSKKLILKNDGLGSLTQIANMLREEMNKEIERNGYSDLTLNLEGAFQGIYEIIELNNIKE